MKRATIFSIFAALVIYCIAGAAQASAQPVDNQRAVVTQARKSYYDLRRKGLSTFQCTMTPDWGLLLQNQGLPPDAIGRAVGILNQLHFIVKRCRR
ncbi:MAG: hypothetical protein M0Z52_00020 [Actinomycetota bacterium]|nr:hypothetical protein [Actinomycetota bacterium]